MRLIYENNGEAPVTAWRFPIILDGVEDNELAMADEAIAKIYSRFSGVSSWGEFINKVDSLNHSNSYEEKAVRVFRFMGDFLWDEISSSSWNQQELDEFLAIGCNGELARVTDSPFDAEYWILPR